MPEVLELDIADADQSAVTEHLASKWGRVDGALHSIGFAPAACLGEDFFGATWDDVSVGVRGLGLFAQDLADIVATR